MFLTKENIRKKKSCIQKRKHLEKENIIETLRKEKHLVKGETPGKRNVYMHFFSF